MKKNLLVFVFIVGCVFSSSAQFTFGGGLSMGTKMGISDTGGDKIGLGLNARANYALKSFDLSGGFTYFFPSAPSGLEMKASQLNVDGHYSFVKQDNMSVYGLAGLNYSFATASVAMEGVSISASDSKVGVNLGAGAKFNKVFVEGKYDTAFEQIAITVGIMF
jgi:opacity protein-like surface antigen